MLNSIPVSVLTGILLGFLGGLGVGGGSLLVLWLTLCLGTDYTTARGINLLFFLPCAVIALLFRRQQGTIQFKKIIPAMVSGCIAAGIFSWLGWYLDLTILKKLFGGVLVITGFRELFYRPRKAR